MKKKKGHEKEKKTEFNANMLHQSSNDIYQPEPLGARSNTYRC